MPRSRIVRVVVSVLLVASAVAFGDLAVAAVEGMRADHAPPTTHSGEGISMVTSIYVISGSIVSWTVAAAFVPFLLVAVARRPPVWWWVIAASALVVTALTETGWRALDLRVEDLDTLFAAQLCAAVLGLAAALAGVAILRAWRGSPVP